LSHPRTAANIFSGASTPGPTGNTGPDPGSQDHPAEHLGQLLDPGQFMPPPD